MLKLTFDKPVKHKWKDCFVKIKSWRKFIILDILLFLIMLLWGQSHCVSHLVCCDNFATRHVLPPTTFGLKTFRFVINYVPALCLMLFYIDNVLNKQFLKSIWVFLDEEKNHYCASWSASWTTLVFLYVNDWWAPS